MTIPDDVLRDALSSVTGEQQVLAADVAWDLRSPCADCPFLKTSPYHEGVAGSLPQYCESIESHTFSHSCHKTDTRNAVDGPVRGKETGRPVQHCAGAAMMLLKTGKGHDLQIPLLQAMERGRLTDEAVRDLTARAKADDRIYTLGGLLRFYAHELAKRTRGIRLRKRKKELQRKR